MPKFGGLNPFNLGRMVMLTYARTLEDSTLQPQFPSLRICSLIRIHSAMGLSTAGMIWGSNGAAFGYIQRTGSVGSRNGSDGATSPDTVVSGAPEHTTAPTIHAKYEKKPQLAHVIGSASARSSVRSIRTQERGSTRTGTSRGVTVDHKSSASGEATIAAAASVDWGATPPVRYPPLVEKVGGRAQTVGLPLRRLKT